MSVAAKVSGANTRAEIFSQPQCWKACFQALEKSQQIKNLAAKFRPATPIACSSAVAPAITSRKPQRPVGN